MPRTISRSLPGQSAFHEEFAAALASAGNAYKGAEAANASASLPSRTLSGGLGALGSPIPIAQSTLQGTTICSFMGGSGLPVPPPSYVTAILNYVNLNFNVPPPMRIPSLPPKAITPLF